MCFLDGLISSVGPEADIIAGLRAFELNMHWAVNVENTLDILPTAALL